MNILALCTVYDDDVKKQREMEPDETLIDAVVSEFSWLHDSGIILNECTEITNTSIDKEYQIFVWDKNTDTYVPVGRPVGNQTICMNRLQERILPDNLDKTRYKICERNVYTIPTSWEPVSVIPNTDTKNNPNEMR